MLRSGYIELLAIVDPALPDNGAGAMLDRMAGALILALGMDDAEANLARLRRAGIDLPGVLPLSRPVEPGGPVARFERLPLPAAPEGRVQLVRHLTPELIWREDWMRHPNGARALRAAIIVSDRPAASAARLSRLAGLPLEPDPAGGFALPLPDGARVRVLAARGGRGPAAGAGGAGAARGHGHGDRGGRPGGDAPRALGRAARGGAGRRDGGGAGGGGLRPAVRGVRPRSAIRRSVEHLLRAGPGGGAGRLPLALPRRGRAWLRRRRACRRPRRELPAARRARGGGGAAARACCACCAGASAAIPAWCWSAPWSGRGPARRCCG